MCAGPQFSGSFRNCTSLSTALYAVHGSAITLRSSSIRCCRVGIVLSGQATIATLDSCTICCCLNSIIAEAGATVKMNGCHILRTGCVRSHSTSPAATRR